MFCFSLVVLFSSLFFALARPVNITVDDRFGSGGIGAPQFFPADRWKTEDCHDCLVNPDASIAHGGTWRAATARAGDPFYYFFMEFQGSAIYIYFILANRNSQGAPTNTACTFYLDDEEQTTFFHTADPSTDELRYDQLVFARTGLEPHEPHFLEGQIPIEDDDEVWWVAFDYAIITVERSDPNDPEEPVTTNQPDPDNDSSGEEEVDDNQSQADTSAQTSGSTGSGGLSTSSRVGAIVGSVLGGIAIVGIILLIWLQRRRRARVQDPVTIDPFPDRPFMVKSHPGSVTDTASRYSVQTSPQMATPASSSLSPNRHATHWSTQYPSSSSEKFPESSQDSVSDPTSFFHHAYGFSGSSSPGTIAPSAVPSGHTSVLLGSPSVSRVARLRELRQRELEQQVRWARETLQAAEAIQKNHDDPHPSIRPKLKSRSKLTEVELAETQTLRSQVSELHERIRSLETAQSSPWAQGFSDEPPPGYSRSNDH